ncbi:hypothetical protein D3C71_1224880 [compost metagenome]
MCVPGSVANFSRQLLTGIRQKPLKAVRDGAVASISGKPSGQRQPCIPAKAIRAAAETSNHMFDKGDPIDPKISLKPPPATPCISARVRELFGMFRRQPKPKFR